MPNSNSMGRATEQSTEIKQFINNPTIMHEGDRPLMTQSSSSTPIQFTDRKHKQQP